MKKASVTSARISKDERRELKRKQKKKDYTKSKQQSRQIGGTKVHCPVKRKQALRFYDALCSELPDKRDKRGKKHNQAFVLFCLVMAILSQRTNVSRMHNYMSNCFERLQLWSGYRQTSCISRAQLPRLLETVDLVKLNELVSKYLGRQLSDHNFSSWKAIDGKHLRGTKGAQVLQVVNHESLKLEANFDLTGAKNNEIAAVQRLLQTSEFLGASVTLDALHMTTQTTELIHSNRGRYLIQLKDNADRLKQIVLEAIFTQSPVAQIVSTEKGHGRLEIRTARVHSLPVGLKIPSNWVNSGFQTCIHMKREVHEISKGKESYEHSFYLSNQVLDSEERALELVNAIRTHWRVETNNHERDVTLKEDYLLTKFSNTAFVLASLRSLALGILHAFSDNYLPKIIDKFTDIPEELYQHLKQVKFL